MFLLVGCHWTHDSPTLNITDVPRGENFVVAGNVEVHFEDPQNLLQEGHGDVSILFDSDISDKLHMVELSGLRRKARQHRSYVFKKFIFTNVENGTYIKIMRTALLWKQESGGVTQIGGAAIPIPVTLLRPPCKRTKSGAIHYFGDLKINVLAKKSKDGSRLILAETSSSLSADSVAFRRTLQKPQYFHIYKSLGEQINSCHNLVDGVEIKRLPDGPLRFLVTYPFDVKAAQEGFSVSYKMLINVMKPDAVKVNMFLSRVTEMKSPPECTQVAMKIDGTEKGSKKTKHVTRKSKNKYIETYVYSLKPTDLQKYGKAKVVEYDVCGSKGQLAEKEMRQLKDLVGMWTSVKVFKRVMDIVREHKSQQ